MVGIQQDSFKLEELLPLIKVMGGALQGAPPHLVVAACMLYAYVAQHGEMPDVEKAGKMIEDFTALMACWDVRITA